MADVSLEFKEILKDEVRLFGLQACVPDDSLIELVLSKCAPVTYPKNSRIIDEGSIDNNVYFLKSGLLRMSYYDEDREYTIGIANTGTVSLSPLSFVMSQKAHYMMTSCTKVELLRLAKEDADRLIAENAGFARWMLGLALAQMAALEFKSKHLTGSSKDKYRNLMKREYIKKRYISFTRMQPDIVMDVSDKVIASYLGVHPAYLSALKREIIEGERSGSDAAPGSLD